MSCLAALFPTPAVNILASRSPLAVQYAGREGGGVVRTRTIHVDLSLNPDEMTKELRELIPEAFKVEESGVTKELISTPATPSLLLDRAALLGDKTLGPTPSPAPVTKPTQTTTQSTLPGQGQPSVAPGAQPPPPSLKDMMYQQTVEASQVTAQSSHGDSSLTTSNSPEDGTKEDNTVISQ